MFNPKRASLLLTLGALLGISLSPAALALGPLDAEAGVVWWHHDIDNDIVGNTGADAPGAYAEIWWAKGWGIEGNYFESDPDRGGFSKTVDMSLDLKRRIISPTDSNFIAFGAGWKDTELLGGSSADGVRLTVDARVGLGILFAYGQAAWMPDMGNAGVYRNIEGTEYHVGVSFTPFPFLNLRLGYRSVEYDFTGGSQTSDGYLLGGAIHF
jgi:hypothetical protein